MKDIALLVNSDDMISMAKDAAKHAGAEDEIEVILTHTYEESLDIARKCESEGARIMIARGGHARFLREAGIGIPVTMIPFTGNNIAALLANAANDWGEFAVIGNPTMIQMTRELERPIGAKIHYYEVVRWADFAAIMPAIRNAGIKAVIGGYDTVRAARAYGLHDYCLKTSEYEIITAITDAKSLLSAMERDRHWDRLFEAALNTIGEGVAVVDGTGAVSHANLRAVKLIGSGGRLAELPLPEMRSQLDKALLSSRPVYDELYEFNGYKFSASFLPIEGQTDNIVMVMQEVEYVHKIERKIRQKLANKGLVAKNTFENICAESPALSETVRIAKQYAIVNSSVLISGETGTGKEMFAQSIHNFSSRRNEAFVAVNCATIPANLLESELFGYVEGAFTGAKRGGKIGLFELAHKGTIFLDEIGETSLDMQARLLRVLEEHEIMRVGDDKVIPIDIRVIAASNRDLRQMVEAGTFRSDFYYRLDVLSLKLPPLRQCRENIGALIDLFSKKYSAQNNRRTIEYNDESLEILKNYNWPGNVRELKNVIERLVVTNSGGTVSGHEAMEALHIKQEPPVPDVSGPETGLISSAESELIRQVLRECGGNKTAAAKKLGISRPTLHRRLKAMEDANAV